MASFTAAPHILHSNPPPQSFAMTSLIEGFFQTVNPRRFEDDSSPQKSKSYLTLYDSYVGLGSTANRVWLPCELRLYSPDQDLNGQVIHVHGRFVAVPSSAEEDPCLRIEVHRFAVMTDIDPASDNPSDTRFSVTVFGRVHRQLEAPPGLADILFSVDASDFIRDRLQSYLLRCRLNKTTSKRWDKSKVPAAGTSVLISGWFDGKCVDTMQLEVETMQFIQPLRGGETAEPVSQTPTRSNFGVPLGSSPFTLQDVKSPESAHTTGSAAAGPSTPTPATRGSRAKKLSSLPVPPAPISDGTAVGPSTPKPSRPPSKRKGKGKAKETDETAPVEPVITDDGDNPPPAKKPRVSTPEA